MSEASATQLTSSVPRYVDRFVGRVVDLEAVAGLVSDRAVRFITLIGPGGVGKTRLLTEVIERLATSADFPYSDGVEFIDLAGIAGPERVFPLIGASLGVIESADGSFEEGISEFLAEREHLLILDNLEHVSTVGTKLVSLVRACPGLGIVGTSRVPLRVSGEHTYVVAPLSLPPMAYPGQAQSDAIELFKVRARGADPHFVVGTQNYDAIAQICRLLDGLPLAIELAAARLRLLSPEALLARLSNRLQVLGRGPVDVPERQRTLRDAIDWSEQLLDEGEKKLFRRLSVFVESF
jgi:predicted ATPase